jgi:thiol-disulfide isomerase/thioredoxin
LQFPFAVPFREGPAVRTLVGVAVVTVCLGLAGCSLFGKKQTARNNNSKPFMGSGSDEPAHREPAAVTNSGSPPPGANGLLAGRVVETSSGRPVKAAIEVKDLEEEGSKAAALEYESKEDGYFTILGVKPGHHYKLIARAKEGGELASGTVFVIPPKPNLYIQINKQYTTPSTPPIPDPPKMPGKKGTTGTESGQERSPAASLAPPIRIAPDKGPPPIREGEPNSPRDNGLGASQGSSPPNLTNVAEEFAHAPRDAKAEIPWRKQGAEPWSTIPPPPEWEGMQGERRPQSAPPPIAPSSPPLSGRVPNPPTRVPSCVLIGNKLENFALNDLNSRAWEYRRDRQGRLVLLDFWYSTCPACKQAMPHLNALQRGYGAYGLQVIGIACETGTVPEQIENVRSVRGRYYINYMTLLSGGGPDHCPVVKQFGVHHYPTLVLLDESGTIIWHCYNGMDDFEWQKLERLIGNKLNIHPR